jgi:hypothetical protein
MGRTGIEDALQSLEQVTLEEARMAATEALKAIHGFSTDIQDMLKAMEDRIMRAMRGTLHDVDSSVKGVRLINSTQAVPLAIITLIVI